MFPFPSNFVLRTKIIWRRRKRRNGRSPHKINTTKKFEFLVFVRPSNKTKQQARTRTIPSNRIRSLGKTRNVGKSWDIDFTQSLSNIEAFEADEPWTIYNYLSLINCSFVRRNTYTVFPRPFLLVYLSVNFSLSREGFFFTQTLTHARLRLRTHARTHARK